MSPNFPNHVYVGFSDRNDLLAYRNTDGTILYSLAVQFLYFFSEALNFAFTIVQPTDARKAKDGVEGSILTLMRDGHIDMAFRKQRVSDSPDADFSFPVDYDRVTYLTQKPRMNLKNSVPVQPFTGTVWVMFLICTLAFLLTFCAMSGRRRQCLRTFFSTLGNVLGQPFSVPLTTTGQAILFAGWILAIPVLLHAFRASFSAFLTVVPSKGLSTIDELASAIEDGHVKCTCHVGRKDLIDFLLLRSKSKSHKIVGECAKENANQSQVAAMYVDPSSVQRTAFIEYEEYLQEFEKGMFISQDSFYTDIAAFPMRKKFRGKKAFNKIVQRSFETGLIQKMTSDFYFRNGIIQEIQRGTRFFKEPDGGAQAMALVDFRLAFGVLGAGLGLALLVLLGEILFHRKCSRKLELKNKIVLKIRKNHIETVIRRKSSKWMQHRNNNSTK